MYMIITLQVDYHNDITYNLDNPTRLLCPCFQINKQTEIDSIIQRKTCQKTLQKTSFFKI